MKLKESIQLYEQKKNENDMVINEMNLLDEEDIVYKLVGPVLVKQATEDAKGDVKRRLDFISGEM
jgi:prefoldin beta subunit